MSKPAFVVEATILHLEHMVDGSTCIYEAMQEALIEGTIQNQNGVAERLNKDLGAAIKVIKSEHIDAIEQNQLTDLLSYAAAIIHLLKLFSEEKLVKNSKDNMIRVAGSVTYFLGRNMLAATIKNAKGH